MSESKDTLRKIASALGASGVALGALGSHALKDTLTKRGTLASWQTATIYQIFHAAAILSLSCGGSSGSSSPSNALAGKAMALGTLLFSGSIYGLSLNLGPKALLGPTTPIGGLLMIGGWILVGLG